ncbi:sigma-54-dependent transcriptional regulator [Sediminispirochaeta bajacaliforniensis]|uniref:sigma-54-dependent transcriptional regulator n=1 Tax=Sediminispirochaeta bajacaliforniensis TaxID=148 RepID=UPI00039E6884|nr:sigma-54 dependent transcriptional regulator [Sediminispirochaeta bajacaliforniensis]
MKEHTILIIDDEPGIRAVLTDILEDEGYSVRSAGDGIEGLLMLDDGGVDVVILDVWLPNKGGIDVLKEIKEKQPEVEVIIISGHANIDLAVKAVKLGAFDFLEKPLALERVITITKNALAIESLKKENKRLKAEIAPEDEMIGSSKAINAVRERIEQSAPSDAKVLITGENGTGKELVARQLHRLSKRSNGPFIEVNCAAIPDTLLESELFGHEKGAFTSAVARRKGKFEIADGGTLFLDEIADMSLSAQAKVLRVIQEQKFERVGGNELLNVDIRLIAATNQDIQEAIASGAFREDLFYRLNVVPIVVPPLRERKEDIPLLCSYFLEKFSVKESIRSISAAGMELLLAYRWPGNVRELKNFVERITIMSDEEEVSSETVGFFLNEKRKTVRPEEMKPFAGMKLSEARDAFERRFIEMKLKEHEYNVSKCAEAIGVYPSNLHGKIKKFGIELKR